jgi:hypothetical protein
MPSQPPAGDVPEEVGDADEPRGALTGGDDPPAPEEAETTVVSASAPQEGLDGDGPTGPAPAAATTAAQQAADAARALGAQATEKGRALGAQAGEKGRALGAQAGEKGKVLGAQAAEGAKVVGDRVGAAAAATAQALRETDVQEIAKSTTTLIETARPFFLAAFATAFSVLAWVEDHASVAIVFALGAVVFVLGAAYSREIDALLTRGRRAPED